MKNYFIFDEKYDALKIKYFTYLLSNLFIYPKCSKLEFEVFNIYE